MKRLIALSLIVALVLLSACGTHPQQNLNESKIQEMEQSIATLTEERDALNAQLQEVQQALSNAQSALEDSTNQVKDLEQSVSTLEQQVYDLLNPPLTECATIRLFGVDAPVFTDGSKQYVLFDSVLVNSGLELNEEDFVTRLWQEKTYITLDSLSALENIVYDETKDGVRFFAVVKDIQPMTEDVNVPVFMYHAVSDNIWGIEELFVSPAEMEKQLAWLVDNGYDPIWFEDLSHLEDYDKPVILNFDDGYDDNYTELFPLLQKYQVKATFFVIGTPNGTAHKMSQEQCREVVESGLVSIQSHSMTHGNLGAMDEETLRWEFSNSCKEIGAMTGEMPYVLCYPRGEYSSLTLEIAKDYFVYGTRMNGRLFNTSVDNPFLIGRYSIVRSTDLHTFAAYCSGAGK